MLATICPCCTDSTSRMSSESESEGFEDAIDWEVATARAIVRKEQAMREKVEKYKDRLKTSEEEIDRLIRVQKRDSELVHTLRNDVRRLTAQVERECDRCSRLRRENVELYDKVKYWEELDRKETNRKRKLRQERDEEAKLERATRLRIRIEEEERERIIKEKEQ